jgi:two-component system response regulator MprA
MDTPAKKQSILIVEDEVSLRNALRDKFVREGFHVLEARDGVEGLEVALREHPDLILFDIVMPKMDGMTMLGKIRADAWGKSVKVIVLTNLSDVGIAYDSYDYLVKSDWKIEDVVATVRERLSK